MTENQALLILNAIDGLTCIRLRKLIAYYGSAVEVLQQTSQQLRAISLVPELCLNRLDSFKRDEFLKSEERLIVENGVQLLSYRDQDYPDLLSQADDAPVLLYLKGDCSCLSKPSVAIVGSRKASLYGINMAHKFAVELAEFGLIVVSGLALGIDAAAHRGALMAQGRTVAVLGCGLSVVYPRQNIKLFSEISQYGLLVSEYPMQSPPLPYNFPKRNRIISGLSLGVVVIEAFLRSGALITARLALEQGREVLALPGNINNPQAQGTNHLIQEGAKLVSNCADILEELKTPLESALDANNRSDEPRSERNFIRKGAPDELVIDSDVWPLVRSEPIHIDDLFNQCPAPDAQVITDLLMLQMKKLIVELPGKYYVRCE